MKEGERKGERHTEAEKTEKGKERVGEKGRKGLIRMKGEVKER